MYILSLADDMTGALEIGAKFAAAGHRALVSTRPMGNASELLVLDTETRNAAPNIAASEVRRFILESNATRLRLIYKKTDSTLRGNISAELRAIAEIFPEWRIGYAPAYPALGRTVKAGVLYVDGVAVAQTAFGSDPLDPVRTSVVADILEPGLNCTIFDGETAAHLDESASAILADQSMRIVAGPAGLAEALARKIELPRGDAPPLPAIRNCIVMNGSLHPCSSSQMLRAEAPGWTVIQADIAAGSNPARVACENGKRLAQEVARLAPDAVFVIGGDTAFAFLDALGLPLLEPLGEVVPGVPMSRIRGHDVLLITKAGGFGEPGVICRVRERLNNAE